MEVTHFFTKLVPDFIEILHLQESGSAPFLDPMFIEGVIMKREY